MICDKCHKRMATIHLTQIINNKKVELHLCENCAREKNYMDFTVTPDVSNFFNSLLGFSGQPYVNTSKPVTCKCCGMTFEDFKESGKLGCYNCYNTFYDRLGPIIKRIHGNAEHAGRGTQSYSSKAYRNKDVSEPNQINSLKKQLEELVRQEKFEEAAKVRDKIKSMENGKKEE